MKWLHFKERLQKESYQQELNTDAQAIWRAIEPQVDELNRRKNRKKFFLLFTLFGLIGLTIGTVFLIGRSHHNRLSADAIRVIEPLIEKQTTERTIIPDDKKSINYNVQAAPEAQKGIKHQSDQNQKVSGSDIIDKSSLSPGLKIESLNTFSSHNTIDLNVNDVIKSQKILDGDDHLKLITTPRKNEVDKSSIGLGITKIKNDDLNNMNTIIIDSESSANEVLNMSQDKLSSKYDLFQFPTILRPIASKNDWTLGTKKLLNIDFPKEINGDLTDDNQEINVNIPSIHFVVGAYAGVSYTHRSLGAKQIDARQELNIRDRYETALEAIHVGLSIDVLHDTGFRLSTGLQRTAITERFKIQETHVLVDSIIDVKRILRINNEGSPISILGKIPQTSTTRYNKKSFNTYTMIDIPLLLGYHRQFGQWYAEVDAGVLFNLSLRTKGKIPDAEISDIDIRLNQADYFKSKLNLRYMFGVSINRSIWRNIDLSISATVQYFAQDITVRNNPISQKYILTGTNIGLKYRL